jgi:hypothetical protein
LLLPFQRDRRLNDVTPETMRLVVRRIVAFGNLEGLEGSSKIRHFGRVVRRWRGWAGKGRDWITDGGTS